MATKLDLKLYSHVETTKNLASSVGSIGNLELNVIISGSIANYEVVHNEKIIYEGDSSYTAAVEYNRIIDNHNA